MREVFDKVDITGKTVLDPFCGTGTTILTAIERNPLKVIGTDIQPDFSEVRYNKLKSICSSKTFFDNSVIMEYGIDANDSVDKYPFDLLVTDPPNPFMILGFSNARHPRDLHMSGKEIKEYWEPRLVEGNLINKGDTTVNYVISLFSKIIKRGGSEIIANLFKTKNGSWSYREALSCDFEVEHVSGQWYYVRLLE